MVTTVTVLFFFFSFFFFKSYAFVLRYKDSIQL